MQKNFWEKMIVKKVTETGHRIIDDHYFQEYNYNGTSEVNPILHCNRALLSKYTMYRIRLISEVILISIVNQSLFCNPILSFFPKRFLHLL